MALLPIMSTGNQATDLWQTRVKSLVDPLLSNKLVQGVFLQNQTLQSGSNTINHTLGRTPIGWFLVDINGQATVWRSASFNSSTLILSSSAGPITVNLWVF